MTTVDSSAAAVPLTEVHRQTSETFDRVHPGGEPLPVSKYGRPKWIILSADDYQTLREGLISNV